MYVACAGAEMSPHPCLSCQALRGGCADLCLHPDCPESQRGDCASSPSMKIAECHRYDFFVECHSSCEKCRSNWPQYNDILIPSFIRDRVRRRRRPSVKLCAFTQSQSGKPRGIPPFPHHLQSSKPDPLRLPKVGSAKSPKRRRGGVVRTASPPPLSACRQSILRSVAKFIASVFSNRARAPAHPGRSPSLSWPLQRKAP